MKTLVIAEKPSVAADIARSLGRAKRKGEYFETEDYLICSAVGHLVELCMPGELNADWRKWSLDVLPMIPEEFKLRPIERAQARYELLVKLMERKDVGALVNACDAGREGELIFRYILRLAGGRKPVKRLWLSSMTAAAIRDGFQKLRDGKELDHLGDAATCRSESDWLVGINGTRAFTCLIYQNPSRRATVGRVQTPTLAMIVEREERIRAFQPKDYWEVTGTFQVAAGDYQGKWFDETFKKDAGAEEEENSDRRADRLWDEARANEIKARCDGKPGEITEETKPASQSSPLLYDLTTLQREANGRFGFSARRTLQIAQSLYERHKMITYPRTDSRALPEDYLGVVPGTLGAIAKGEDLPPPCEALSQHARTVLDNDWVKPNRRIFNNAKVSDHFAIIPTGQFSGKLDEVETKLFDLIAKRFIAIFFPPARFEVTTRITRVAGEPFKTEGKILREAGWLAVYGRDEEQADKKVPAVAAGEQAATLAIEVAKLATRPPARYTEATILTAMETAGKLLEDEELREAMKERGLGTPATRAQIIEGLISEQYIHREGRDLLPFEKAIQLIELLRSINVEELVSPTLTGEWEHKLREIEHGRMSRGEFMSEIESLTRKIIGNAKEFEKTDHGAKPFPSRCPIDGAEMVETFKAYRCVNGDFSIPRTLGGRRLERDEALELIAKRCVGPIEGFRSKRGKAFSATLRLTDEGKVEFDFEGLGGPGVTPDFSGHEPMGKCPACGATVYEAPMAYVCEKAVGAKPAEGEAPACGFKLSKKILGRDIPRDQAVKLLVEGKTDLLDRFWSRRTRRPFSAHLTVNSEGKVGFAFAPRVGGKKKEEAGDGSVKEAAPAYQAPVKPAKAAKPVKAAKAEKKARAPKAESAAKPPRIPKAVKAPRAGKAAKASKLKKSRSGKKASAS